MIPDLILFFGLALVAIASALGMLLSKNAIYSALNLIINFITVSIFYLLLNAPFIALTQITVYAGAIMVLFLFVIMLLNLGHDYQRDLRGGLWAILAFIMAGGLAGVLARQFGGAEASPFLGNASGAAVIDELLAEQGAVGAIAQSLFTDYLVAFEITGILLLVAIIGAIALAKRRV